MVTAAPRHSRGARWGRRYAAFLRAAWLVDLQYRADLVLWLVWGIVEPAVALSLWWGIAAEGTVEGYDRSDFVRYFFAVTFVNQFTQAWDAWSLDQWIGDGEMNHRLLRPVAPVHEALADNIAYKARTGALVLILWLSAAAVWPMARVQLTPSRFTMAALAIVLAAAIRFLNGFAVGLVAFWTTRASALIELQMAIAFFLSGELAPLTMLPPHIASIARALWFPYVIGFPAEVVAGTMAPGGDYMRGVAMQALWLAIWLAAYHVLWSRGRRRYGAVGG